MHTFSNYRIRWQVVIAFLLVQCHLIHPLAYGQGLTPKKVSIANDVTLHYVEQGDGEPIVFVHGLLDEYSTWLQQLQGFAGEGYRAIAYSRRHNYPNKNRIRPNHSASLEADDLSALVHELDVEKVHVVGHSYGAYTALFFAHLAERKIMIKDVCRTKVVFFSHRKAFRWTDYST